VTIDEIAFEKVRDIRPGFFIARLRLGPFAPAAASRRMS